MRFFNTEKTAGYTQHGAHRERARAKAYATMAKEYREAGVNSPGLDYIKGTFPEALIMQLLARKQAYKSQLQGLANIKGHIPFVGMGPAGQRALNDIMDK